MATALRVLIVGGYGTFGGRLVHLLRDEQRLELLVAGRSLTKAAALCAGIVGAARLHPTRFDRDGELDAQLQRLAPQLVVDASGPFQIYGEQPYRLAQACIRNGIDYLDLADAAAFVRGVRSLDHAAKAAGVFVLSGVSSFPVLTTAVVQRLAEPLARIDSIRAGIAPSPHAGVGRNVIRAVAGYAGVPIELRREGQRAIGYGFLEQQRMTIAPPGRLPLKNTLFSLVEVPDLQLLPELYPQVRTVWMGAGPVPQILHRALIALSWLRRMRLAPRLERIAPLMHWAVRRLRWGEHRGGMFIEIEGAGADGRRVEKSWHLLAEGDDGPFIPSMAAEIVIRDLLAGRRPAAGARSAAGEISLLQYERLFAHRAIFTGVRDASTCGAPLYARVLGSAWQTLPSQIRAMHDVQGCKVANGTATVDRGSSLLARCVAAAVGFPRTASQVPVSVVFDVKHGVERWTRHFGSRSFSSEQSAGSGRDQALVRERFGPVSVALALVVEGERLRLVVRGWRLFGLPLPGWLAPACDAHESVIDGRFHFDVAISHPWTGPIVHYRGWLVPGAESVEAPALATATAGAP